MLKGQKVCAVKPITEGGHGFEPDPAATFPSKHYTHALPGDYGVVAFVDATGNATVRFERTGTATVVGLDEVERAGAA